MSALACIFLVLAISQAATVPSLVQPLSKPSPVRTSPSTTRTLAPNRFNYKIPNTGISLEGSYNPGVVYKLPPAGFNTALFEIHQRAKSHIDTIGDGPLLPTDNPMTEVMTRGSTWLEPYELVVGSHSDKSLSGDLTYGIVRDAMDATRGLGYLMRWIIHYQYFRAEIVSASGERLGVIESVWVPPSTRFQNTENATQTNTLTKPKVDQG